LEILASAREEAGFEALDRALAALPQAPVTSSVYAAALAAARELRGSRRLPAADYLIAAAAAERGFGVLHLDAHYDTLASVITSPASGWIATDRRRGVNFSKPRVLGA